ncbi:MAG: hypothetical protein J5800_04080 [Spirochaetales bacterium]|nr:hypothetical protein [Spirochaetales bacterium]
MANSKSASFDFGVITKRLVGILLAFMGIAGFISTRGTDFTRPLFKFLSEDAFIYIVSAVVALAGVGIFVDGLIKGMPAQVGAISGIVAVVFWALVILFKDITTLGDVEMVDFVQSIIVDLLIFFAILQSTILGSKK